MEITATMVKALRDRTGLPMLECKKALTEAGGDAEKAVEILRRAGLGQLAKRAGRETAEGRVFCYADPAGNRAGIAELRCETAPVANTDDFLNLAKLVAQQAAGMRDPSVEAVLASTLPTDAQRTISDAMHDAVNRLRENIRVVRAASVNGCVGHYIHHNGQVGVVVELSGDCPPALRMDVCMHIAAMNPPYNRREDVPPAEVEKERALAAEQVKDKPPQMIDKIVAGKLNRWYGEIVLHEQPFVKDDKKTVGQVLLAASPGLGVKRFVRYEVGGS